jgi:hypothetical protein
MHPIRTGRCDSRSVGSAASPCPSSALHPIEPRLRSCDGARFYTGTTQGLSPRMCTRPPPVFCSGNHARTNRIALDVAEHGQQVRILFDGKRFEPSLPDMPTGLMPLVIPSHMRREKPLHPPTQITIAVRPHRQVKMIGHQAIRQDAHRDALTSLCEQRDARLIVSPSA